MRGQNLAEQTNERSDAFYQPPKTSAAICLGVSVNEPETPDNRPRMIPDSQSEVLVDMS